MFNQTISLPGLSTMKAVALRLKPGEDLKAALDNFIKLHHIPAACVITCAGSLQQAAIRHAGRNNADVTKGRFEITSLSGTLSESGSHLHISICDENGKSTGGHLKENSLVYTTAEIVLGILTDVVFEREPDSTYGYKELLIKQASGEQ